MKSFKSFCCVSLMLVSMTSLAEVSDSTEVKPLGYSETSISQKVEEQFDKFLSKLKSYDITVTKPETFSVTDKRGREYIGENNINPKWRGALYVNINPAGAIMEADNQEAAYIIHEITQYDIQMPKLRDAEKLELELRNSYDNRELDVTPMVNIIAKDDMSDYAYADTIAFYEFDFKKPFLGGYNHCIGIYLQKAAHPAMYLKVALNDKSYEKKDEYVRLLLDNIIFGDSPDELLVYSENAINKNETDFNFPTKYRTYTGILPDINDETLEEINRSKAWLEAHGMQELPKISEDALEALNSYKAGREQRQAQLDSIENADTPKNLKVYPNPVLERQPQFPGEHSFAAEDKWIKQNLKYPADAKKKGLQGSVRVKYTVMADGSIENIVVKETKPNIPSFEKEAVRLIKTMPKWIPAKFNGKNVCANSSSLIYFVLPPEERAKIAAKVKPSDPVEEYDIMSHTVRAEYPGGTEALNEWIAKNINYSDEVIEAMKNSKFKEIPVEFTIDRDGSVINPHISLIFDKVLSMEALRVVENMPKWIPLFQYSKPIKSHSRVAVKFQLPEK